MFHLKILVDPLLAGKQDVPAVGTERGFQALRTQPCQLQFFAGGGVDQRQTAILGFVEPIFPGLAAPPGVDNVY